MQDNRPTDHGAPFIVNIEGTEYPWQGPTITTEQIAELGHWDASGGVLEADLHSGEERTLAPHEVVGLKPGMGFSKKILFKRGDASHRIAVELEMIRSCSRSVDVDPTNSWVRIPDYAFPPGWGVETGSVVIRIPDGYPGAPPYGFWIPAGMRFNGQMPGNYTEPSAQTPPFEGQWGFFSWTWETPWCPTADPSSGPNLLNWLLGLRHRLAEGV